jgi:hypothetical protein
VSQAPDRIRQAARERRKERFTALFHHINIELLEAAFYEVNANAAAGVDGVTWDEYEADLGHNLEDLHARLDRGAYRAMPSRRHYIPKSGGRQRPLAIDALKWSCTRGLPLPRHRTLAANALTRSNESNGPCPGKPDHSGERGNCSRPYDGVETAAVGDLECVRERADRVLSSGPDSEAHGQRSRDRDAT